MNRSRFRSGAIRLTSLAVIGLAACSRQPWSETGPAASSVPASSLAISAPPPALDSRTLGWSAGTLYNYRLQLTTTVSFGSASNSVDFDLIGDVQIVRASAESSTVRLYANIQNPKLTSRVAGTQADFEKLATQMGQTSCFFTLSGGRVIAIHLPPEASAIVANTYRQLGASLQFARSASGADRYTANEYDTTGEYVAEYTHGAQPDEWRKEKRKYLGILAAKSVGPNVPAKITPQVVRARADVHLSPEGRPEVVNEEAEVLVTGGQTPIRATHKLSLTTTAAQPLSQPSPDLAALLASMRRTDAAEPFASQTTIEALDDARIQGRTFETIVSRLEATASKGGARGPLENAQASPEDRSAGQKVMQEDSQLFIALAATLRKKPETIPKAIKKIRAGSPAASIIVGALGSASTVETQQALIELSKSNDPKLRGQAMGALARTSNPSAASIDAMKAMLAEDPFSMQALYSLGSYARRLRDGGKPELAQEIGELLLERLKAADGTSRLVIALRAVMNSGYAGALPQVSSLLSDGRDEVRAAAVRALQSMNDARVNDVIAVRLTSDASSDVRLAAAEAAQMRGPDETLAGAVAKVAIEAPDPRVRYRAVELMLQWLPQRAELRSTIDRVAANDAVPRVRDRAKSPL